MKAHRHRPQTATMLSLRILPLLLLLAMPSARPAKVPTGAHKAATKAATANAAAAAAAHAANNIEQRFAMEPQDQTAIVGSRVTLPCRVIGKNGMLQWTKDDFGLGTHRNLSGFERYSMVGSDEEGDFSLDIYPVMLDDDARYQCQVGPSPTGAPGIRSRFATLTILVPPEQPKIVQGDYLLTTEDREIELECTSVGGKPAAEITWIDGLGNVLTSGIDYMKEQAADSRRFTAKSVLKLTPKKEHHNTTFTCQAQNTADRTYRSARLRLEVKYAPKVKVTVVGSGGGGAFGGNRLAEGSDVTVVCRSDANPPEVTYRWYINEELVVGDYTTELVIHNISRRYHDAIVKCEVHNAVGKSEESEALDISYGPVFHTKPKSVEADISGTVSFSCDVDGNPPPEILWIHEANDRVVGTSSNLTLHVTHDSAGAYLCRASVPGFADIQAVATVYLKGPPTIMSATRQLGIIGDTARVECVAFSVPRARHVSWTFEGREIQPGGMDADYAVLEEALPEGVRSTLVIRESGARHFGRYNCTVVNDHGNDVIEIDLVAQKTLPSLMIVVGSVSSVAVLLMVVMLFVLYFRKGKKKLPPADVIPEHHHHSQHHHLNHHNNHHLSGGGGGGGGHQLTQLGGEKSAFAKAAAAAAAASTDADRTSNISDLKVDIRAGSCEPDGGSESCSGTDSIATRIAATVLGSGGGGGGGGGGVPLAGPVKIPGEYSRFSGDYTDSASSLMLPGHGKNNNGYVPYGSTVSGFGHGGGGGGAGDYSREYSSTLSHPAQHQPHSQHTLPHRSGGGGGGGGGHGSNATLHSAAQMNGGQLLGPNGNMSLTRNRLDLRQDNGLPNVGGGVGGGGGGIGTQGSMQSLQSSLMGQPALLQNGLSIDPRYSAAYGNPYLMRTSNSSLPPLPPPSTANPAATPAPPPYASVRANAAAMLGHANALLQQQQQQQQQNQLQQQQSNSSSSSGGTTTTGNSNPNSGVLLGTVGGMLTPASLSTLHHQHQQHQQQQQQQHSSSTPSSTSSGGSNTTSTSCAAGGLSGSSVLLANVGLTSPQSSGSQQLQQQQQQQPVSSSSNNGTTASATTTTTTTSPSGQFILPANGNLKKGSLATHV